MLLEEKIQGLIAGKDTIYRKCSNIYTSVLASSGSMDTKNYMMLDILYHLLEQNFVYQNINFELYKYLGNLIYEVAPIELLNNTTLPITVNSPELTVSDTDPITFSDTLINTNSTSASLTFSANYLTSGVTIRTTSGFLVSLNATTGFSTELFFSIEDANSIPNTTIFVAFHPSSVTSYSDVLTFSTNGVTDIDINLSGVGIAAAIPAITLSANSLIPFAATLPGTISLEEQSYTISATQLAGNLIVTPPTDFEISKTTSIGFTGSPLTFIPSSGAVSVTVFVRFHPTQLKFYNARISNESSGAITKYIVVQGTGAENTSLLDSAANSTTDGYLKHEDWNTFNNKQNQLNGTGFVKASGTTISYDPATYQVQLNGTGFVKASGTSITYDSTSYTSTARQITINGTAYDLSSDRTWTISDITGNAGTATKLAVARNINGVPFDGTSDISITAVPAAHTHSGGDITSAVANATNSVNSTNSVNATNAGNADTLDSQHGAYYLDANNQSNIPKNATNGTGDGRLMCQNWGIRVTTNSPGDYIHQLTSAGIDRLRVVGLASWQNTLGDHTITLDYNTITDGQTNYLTQGTDYLFISRNSGLAYIGFHRETLGPQSIYYQWAVTVYIAW